MITDLHSHILPGIDDGSPDLGVSLEMARIAVAGGTRVMACTPHVNPGVYDNTPESIGVAVDELQLELDAHGVDLKLTSGGDVHLIADLDRRLAEGRVPTLGRTRYLLLEPPHHVCPPNLDRFAARLVERGFVPIVTHPERLSWAAGRFDLFGKLQELGCLHQLTGSSVDGVFGRRVSALARQFLSEGLCDVVASDAHDASYRTPDLSSSYKVVAEFLGPDAARRMFCLNPSLILQDRPVERVASLPDGRKRRRNAMN